MDDYPLLNIFLTMMWFFLWILWLMLLFRVIVDIFRDDTLSGWAKAGWSIFVIVLPLLGVFVYLVVRGKGMGRREVAAMLERESRAYDAAARRAGRSASHAEELARLADLKNHGDLTAEEYERAKAKVLAG
ncbi:SHOCT domain-containing protein [Thermostaphylospora chromogena]|uniref:Phospholipase_D-nuclease N-terminal n=1 Tax=Thermostaphylospora chromogena TaxID=35622 RepID=A0A1H1FM67_9ACTN|nr:SHOCT domain-containing protein [Thermostaphylospora chromogena]SDR01878.1 Phospholipase_D-nuclease N-terminal [Thermostaphylospora chromogena]